MISNLARRLAVIQDNSSVDGASNLRKMGRQMASHGFIESLKRHGGGNPQFMKAKLPSPSLRAYESSWEALFIGDPNLHPFANERLWNDPRRYSLIGITHTLSTPGPRRSWPIFPKHPFTQLGCLDLHQPSSKISCRSHLGSQRITLSFARWSTS